MATSDNELFYDQNKTLKNNELLLKILYKKFEKINRNWLRVHIENQSLLRPEVFLKAEETSLDFTVESFRNKIQPGNIENWSFKLAPTNTLH
jgi:hypothetical protein